MCLPACLPGLAADAHNNRAKWDRDSCGVPSVAFDGNSVQPKTQQGEFQVACTTRNRLFFPPTFFLVGPAQEVPTHLHAHISPD